MGSSLHFALGQVRGEKGASKTGRLKLTTLNKRGEKKGEWGGAGGAVRGSTVIMGGGSERQYSYYPCYHIYARYLQLCS